MSMEKIIRLSWANIRKHKMETVSLLVLVMLCMLLMGSALAGIAGIREIFPQLMEHTGGYENYMLIATKDYDNEFETIMRNDDRVEKCVRSNLLYSMNTSYLNAGGKEQSMFMAFTTEDYQKRIENLEIETTLTNAELAAIEHPIYFPQSAKASLGILPGDKFTMVYGSRKFEYTAAGYYETLLLDTAGGGMKMIVSENDYRVLETYLTKYTVLAYNDHQGQGGETLMKDMVKAFEDYSGNDVESCMMGMIYDVIKGNIDYSLKMLMGVLILMAVIIILAVAVMIRFRIAGDIKEQIVSIGVLEALGYTSREIAASYVFEYLLIALAGAVPGIAGCFVLTPALHQVGGMMIGHASHCTVSPLPILLTAAAILLFVAVIALIRASIVRHYPPVRAFRKGQGDHRFGKEHFPLRDTRTNVHLRLAMKGFVSNFRQNLGLSACITVSAVAIIFSFILFSFFGFNLDAINSSAGMELSDIRLEMMPSVDAKEFAAEIETMPEVRKATPATGWNIYLFAPDQNTAMLPMAFTSFDVTENIFPISGRFPEHDNEIMVTNMFAKNYGLQTGDTLALEYMKIKRQYLVTGIVTSTTNGGVNLYITEDGMRRIVPTYQPDSIEVYLEKGTDTAEFRRKITELYGRSLSDAVNAADGEGTLEERIRAEADRRIAELLASGNTSHVEYAIQVGDTVITGNSSNFRIKSIQCIGDIMRTQLAGVSMAISALTAIFIILSALVVMIILFILMESSVRKQRREFGIMLGCGYTTRELMFQMASRIMPAAFGAVAIGTVCGVLATNLMTSYIGKVAVNLPAVLVVDVLLLAFCFGCAYFGARKIKKISVCELMTE